MFTAGGPEMSAEVMTWMPAAVGRCRHDVTTPQASGMAQVRQITLGKHLLTSHLQGMWVG